MKETPLGITDITLSRTGSGTWAIGGDPTWNGDLDRQMRTDTTLEVHRCGINLIDTAPGYNFGNSEVIVGQVLKKLPREQVAVETKCGIVWERKGGLFNKAGDRQLYKDLSPEFIREEAAASLWRLSIDYIDIYMTHWQSVPPFFTPIAETAAVLSELKSKGKIRVIGVANVDADHIREYLQYGELGIIQAKYSTLDRAVENELLSLCHDNGIMVQAYSPLEQGLLTDIIIRDYISGGVWVNKVWFQRENMLKVIDMLERWQPFCTCYQCTIPTLALVWISKQSDLISIPSGATAPERVHENVAALNINLSDTDVTLMREMVEVPER